MSPRAAVHFVSCLLVLLAGEAFSAEKTLWLVRPLYPGQEALVGKTEQALDKLIPPEGRGVEIIGRKELATALKGKKVDEIPCLSGSAPCADPISSLVSNLGFERVVLVKGGQDENGYKFQVVSFKPATGETNPATGSGSNLEKALLGALVKVVPLASTLEVRSTPAGATVFVDDLKVGTTPLSTQVLPGEHVIRLDLKLHQGVEETTVIPVRGNARFDRVLEKVAARLLVSATPPGTVIELDGQVLGKDRVDRGVQPGPHTLRLTADEHKAFEQRLDIKADEQIIVNQALEPMNGEGVKAMVVQVPGQANPVVVAVAPVKPPTDTELNYGRTSYFQIGLETGRLTRPFLIGRRGTNPEWGRSDQILDTGGDPMLIGAGLEYGIFGKYFGVTVFGMSYLTNLSKWNISTNWDVGRSGYEQDELGNTLPEFAGKIHLLTLRMLQPQLRLAVWRFMFSAQVGLDVRLGQIADTTSPTFYENGFLITDLMVSGRANARFYVAGGFYLYGSYYYSQYLIGWTNAAGSKSGSSHGLDTGVGYGF